MKDGVKSRLLLLYILVFNNIFLHVGWKSWKVGRKIDLKSKMCYTGFCQATVEKYNVNYPVLLATVAWQQTVNPIWPGFYLEE